MLNSFARILKIRILEISREILNVEFSFLKRRIELVNAVLSVNHTCHGIDFTKKPLAGSLIFAKDDFNI